ncbi:histidine phosphatase family protein [Planococcus beigongshangi]|uniref:histidine phosphatase family protein n=1 Tax=Planococcus beigongshangi TaxID=2782536 RepID=UPI00193B29FC
MELTFIRHGQGEHTMNLPDSLQMNSPALTHKGRIQAKRLNPEIPITSKDALIASPTLRTLQTAAIWSENMDCRKFVSPLAGPRIFPYRLDAATLPCDELLDLKRFKEEFPDFIPVPSLAVSLWSTGINVKTEDEFNLLAEEFIGFCRSLQCEKIYIVTHDGTITSYRQKISGQPLTRADFLKEAEWVRLILK